MARDLVKVIDACLPLLEAQGINTAHLRRLREKTQYTAPELRQFRWAMFSMWLLEQVEAGLIPKDPKDTWAEQLSDLVEGRLDPEKMALVD